MDFNPANTIVKLCLQGMELEQKGRVEEALRIFLQAFHDATNDFERFMSAYFVAKQQKDTSDRLHWLEKSLQFAQDTNDDTVKSAFPSIYSRMAECYEETGDTLNAKKHRELATFHSNHPSDKGPFYHGTKADLKAGDLLNPGGHSNYQADLKMNHIYFTGLVNGAGLAAALAKGDGPERVYMVEPTGSFENDPNVTDKKFPGNPTRSYRSLAPLKIVGEAKEWVRMRPEDLQKFRDRLANNKGGIIN